MDVYLNTSLEKLNYVLSVLGFTFKHRRKYIWSQLREPGGRMHAQFVRLDSGEIYLDLHFDKTLHAFFINVDYKIKPGQYFSKYLKPILENNNIKYRTQEVNWLTRKNKAIFTGLRI